ncbi:MAG: hypothetical protein HC780_16875 [Leptolyngbyaceae cyanobacterium CSU_1_3]|nr:hypothetical protein [Leptolyngbyaceae cyanobacterium CSU_1_3]
MKSPDSLASACRHCRHYVPQGRRGGHCNQLSVPVRGSWRACSLALPVFALTWDFAKIRIWKEDLETYPQPIAGEFSPSSLQEAAPTRLEAVAASSEKLTA